MKREMKETIFFRYWDHREMSTLDMATKKSRVMDMEVKKKIRFGKRTRI